MENAVIWPASRFTELWGEVFVALVDLFRALLYAVMLTLCQVPVWLLPVMGWLVFCAFVVDLWHAPALIEICLGQLRTSMHKKYRHFFWLASFTLLCRDELKEETPVTLPAAK